MPKVPQYAESQRLGNMPDIRAGVDGRALSRALDGGMWDAVIGAGRQLQATGGKVGDIALDQMRMRNEAVALERFTQAEAAILDLQTEQGKRNGGNALTSADGKTLGVADTVRTGLEKMHADLSKDMNPAQKRLFDASFNSRAQGVLRWGSSYEAQQENVWQDSVDDGAIAAQGQRIAMEYNNPQAVSDGLGVIEDAGARKYGRMGLAPEEIAARIRGDKQVHLLGAFQIMLDRDEVGQARRTLSLFGPDMGAEKAAHVLGLIKNKEEALRNKWEAEQSKILWEKADAFADSLSAKVADGDIDPSAAYQQLLDIKDKKERQYAMSSYGAYSQGRNLVIQEQSMNAKAGMYDHMEQLASENNLGGMWKAMQDAEAACLADPKNKVKKAAYDHAKVIYNQVSQSTGVSRFSNPDEFNQAVSAITFGNITKAEQLKANYPGIAPVDMKRLEGQLNDAQKVDAAMVNRYFIMFAGQDPDADNMTPEDRRALNTQKMAVLQKVMDDAKVTNRGRDEEWIKKKVEESFKTGLVASNWWGTNKSTRKETLITQQPFGPDFDSPAEQAKAAIAFNKLSKEEQDAYMEKTKKNQDSKANRAIAIRMFAAEQRGPGNLGAYEPERPEGLPDNAVWSKENMGWIVGDRFLSFGSVK